jgi:hypothetical protein
MYMATAAPNVSNLEDWFLDGAEKNESVKRRVPSVI